MPELVLEVEELELEQVSAVLPDEAELALGQVSIPAPGSRGALVDDEAFACRCRGSPAATETTSVFSSGASGAGTREPHRG